MGPRFINRGEDEFISIPLCFDVASMGPRFINRGEGYGVTVDIEMVRLQWGRGL